MPVAPHGEVKLDMSGPLALGTRAGDVCGVAQPTLERPATARFLYRGWEGPTGVRCPGRVAPMSGQVT